MTGSSAAAAAAGGERAWGRRAVALIVVGFVVSRVVLALLAAYPQRWYVGPEPGPIDRDVTLYRDWAYALLDRDRAAYVDVAIEYPPGALPFLLAPVLVRPWLPYRTAFLLVMMSIDVAALMGLFRLSRRWGSPAGPGVWTVFVPLLGPIAYLRFDLVPAVATIWFLVALAAGSSRVAGVWLGLGTAAKLYPALLLPAAFLAVRRRRQLAVGVVAAFAATLAPFAARLMAVYTSVLVRNATRGIQLESVWASGVQMASLLGHRVAVGYGFGSMNVESSVTPTLRLAAAATTVAVVTATTWIAARAVPAGEHARLAAALFAVLSAAVAASTVLSPQFLLWLGALAAAATCAHRSPVGRSVGLLLPAALLTQCVYPFLYPRLIEGAPAAIVVLTVRNLLLVVVAVSATAAVWRSRPNAAVAQGRSSTLIAPSSFFWKIS